MLKQQLKYRQARITLLLVGLSFALAACTVGPFEVSLRGNAANQFASSDPAVGQTVTAVLATNTAIAVLRTATAVAFVPAQPPAVTSPPPTAIPQIEASGLRLVYSPDSFMLLNTGTRQQDISGLSFHSTAGELSISSWDNGYLTASLYTFPSGDCLMAWGLNAEYQDKPSDCDVRHAWIAVNNQQMFWQDAGTFSVRWYGQPVAECATNSGSCAVTLP